MNLGFDAREVGRIKRAGYVTEALVAPQRKYPLKLTVSAVVAACKFYAKATDMVTTADITIQPLILLQLLILLLQLILLQLLKNLTKATAIVTASDTV